MADMVVATKPLTRAELSEIAKSPRQRKYLEDLGKDVGTTLPSAVDAANQAAATAQAAAVAAQAAANAAQVAANAAQAAVNALAELISTSGLDVLPAQVGGIQAQIKTISDRIASFEEGPRYA